MLPGRLSVFTEQGELIREVDAPCAKKHHFEGLSQHPALDRLLRTYCKECLIVWDLTSEDAEVPFRLLDQREEGLTPSYAIHNRMAYKKDAEKLVSVVPVEDAGTESAVRSVDLPLHPWESLMQVHGEHFVLYGGRQRSTVLVVRRGEDGDIEQRQELYSVEASMSGISTIYSAFIGHITYDTRKKTWAVAEERLSCFHYLDMSTMKVIDGPRWSTKDGHISMQTQTGEGDLHVLLTWDGSFGFQVKAISMRTGKLIRSWQFAVPDPDPKESARVSKRRGCDSTPLLSLHGMMIYQSELLIELGFWINRYQSRLFSVQLA